MESTIQVIDMAISHYMVDQKINREQMAELMHMAPNTLRTKRNGEVEWRWNEILHLCDLLKLSPNDLVGKC